MAYGWAVKIRGIYEDLFIRFNGSDDVFEYMCQEET